MNEQRAREILGADVQADNSLHNGLQYLHWDGGATAVLDGDFSADDLEAIAWWMRNVEVRR